MEYKVKFKKIKYMDIIVEAKNKKEAKRKAVEGEYKEIIKDEFILPSTEWEIIKVEKQVI